MRATAARLRDTSTNWPIVQISDIAEHCLGKMLDKHKNKGTPLPYLRNINVRWFEFDLSDLLEMRFEEHEVDRYQARKGDLVICEGGYPGRAAVWESDEPIYLQKALHRVRFHDPERAKWVLYWLYFKDLNGSLSASFSGTGIQHFTKSALERFEIPLPPLDEQKRIVAVLDQAFAALDRARVHVEANQQDASEMFENTLLATFEEILASSKTLTLSEAAHDFSRGKSKHRPRNDPSLYDGEYPFIQTGDIRRSNGIIGEHSQSYNKKGLAQSKLWPTGTVCITIAANIAETGVLDFAGCFPDSVIGMVPNAEITGPYYVEYMLRFFAKELKLQGKGSAQDNINLATFERAKFPFPELSIQAGIVEKLDRIAAATSELRSSPDFAQTSSGHASRVVLAIRQRTIGLYPANSSRS